MTPFLLNNGHHPRFCAPNLIQEIFNGFPGIIQQPMKSRDTIDSNCFVLLHVQHPQSYILNLSITAWKEKGMLNSSTNFASRSPVSRRPSLQFPIPIQTIRQRFSNENILLD
uniref:Uncharacterized protein n=1 Tax=Physcomitrium patens TaxID=3218 RepID=A0A2K1IA54_PHYPA|nr:hypothetical protein PHYPA_030734 [Physcomitrium patens]